MVNYRQPFWTLESADEIHFVRQILKHRFPETYSLLTDALEHADPLEVVYPGNSDEYGDVVREIIVIADRVNGDLGVLSRKEIEALVKVGLSRCFGEEPDAGRVDKAVDLVHRGMPRR
ncbi:hypothetical protein [Kribbella sp. VKM Ac-2568]|uniref:hypothetical protein n=1 Tax=Kribbella sp. VKM Ac-2568 TaxID=2512219 RepID=UPI0010458542|nr:hypothetical protein [Kribbella sp. VKM Ac-2568]TCM48841.1 hypothetical protein EV648_103105 [Kribbella sp. VKM Ac-2568]